MRANFSPARNVLSTTAPVSTFLTWFVEIVSATAVKASGAAVNRQRVCGLRPVGVVPVRGKLSRHRPHGEGAHEMSKSKFSPIVAVTALVVAVLGSTPLGHAAAHMILPSNSVGSAQLTSNAVTGLKVKNGTLLAADFKAGQLPVGAPGAKGDTGAAGPKGDQGDTGANAVIRVSSHLIDPNSDGWWRVYCLAGERATGGGSSFQDVIPGDAIMMSRAINAQLQAVDGSAPVGWLVYAHNGGASPRQLYVNAVC